MGGQLIWLPRRPEPGGWWRPAAALAPRAGTDAQHRQWRCRWDTFVILVGVGLQGVPAQLQAIDPMMKANMVLGHRILFPDHERNVHSVQRTLRKIMLNENCSGQVVE